MSGALTGGAGQCSSPPERTSPCCAQRKLATPKARGEAQKVWLQILQDRVGVAEGIRLREEANEVELGSSPKGLERQ